jgi:G3E family GTPase
VSQVAFADRILLNKIDLVSAEQLQVVIDTIWSINAVAEVIQTTNSVVDLKKVLGVSSFSIEKTLEVGAATGTPQVDEWCNTPTRLRCIAIKWTSGVAPSEQAVRDRVGKAGRRRRRAWPRVHRCTASKQNRAGIVVGVAALPWYWYTMSRQ